MKNKKPKVFHNIIANFGGKAWHAVFSLAFIPIYVSIMGVEAYGLLGIFLSLSAILGVMDLGLGATLGRELARLSVIEGSEQESRNLVRTFETVFWGIGVLSGLIVIFLAPLLTEHWINSSVIDSETVEKSLIIMGLMLIFQWPAAIYSGGLKAVQRQVTDNVIRSLVVMLKHVGAVIVLLFISPSVLAFFLWHTFVELLKALLLSKWLWKFLPETSVRAKFDKHLLVKNWKFTSGMFGITLVSMLLSQVDKIILSKMLTLEIFGYYMLAFSLANAIHGLKNPILTAVFPRYTQLATASEEGVLIVLYHKSCQYLSALIIPMAVVVALNSKVVLMFWLGDEVIVQNTQLILALLIIGAGINSIMTPPFMMQIAYGWTKLTLYKGIIAVICIIPLTVWLVGMFQGVGAAWSWIILNLGYLIFEIPIMHRSILKTEMWRWYLIDIMFPSVIAAIIGYISYMLISSSELPVFLSFIWILFTYLIGVISIVLLLPLTRRDFLHYRRLFFEKVGRMW